MCGLPRPIAQVAQ